MFIQMLASNVYPDACLQCLPMLASCLQCLPKCLMLPLNVRVCFVVFVDLPRGRGVEKRWWGMGRRDTTPRAALHWLKSKGVLLLTVLMGGGSCITLCLLQSRAMPKTSPCGYWVWQKRRDLKRAFEACKGEMLLVEQLSQLHLGHSIKAPIDVPWIWALIQLHFGHSITAPIDVP